MYDFYMGRELNPRLGNLDLKFFCELRPGLLLWLLLDLSILAEYCDKHSLGGTPGCGLFLVVMGHALYVVDALYFEVRNIRLWLFLAKRMIQ